MARKSKKQKNQCTTCKYARYDEVWGEYKCDILKRKIHHPENITECVYHEKKDK